MPRDGHEIASAAKRARRKARVASTPNEAAPSASIGAPEGDAGGQVQVKHGAHPGDDLAAIVSELADLQRRRRFCIVSQSRIDRSIESLIASTMGLRLDAPEKDRKVVFARAKAFRLSVERGGEDQDTPDTQSSPVLSAIVPLILTARANRLPWDNHRKRVEKAMAHLARQLPCYAFAKQVRGLGDLALGALQGEAGIPFGETRTVSGLWKRMGLAVIGGARQRRKKGDAAAEHAYSPRRRAQVYAFVSDSMFRHQWRAANEETGAPAQSAGPYGDVYAQRRAHTWPRIEATADLADDDPSKWTKGRCHNDARRVMSKALLRDLWRVSRGLPPRGAGIVGDAHVDV